jgi:hypothetical protein
VLRRLLSRYEVFFLVRCCVEGTTVGLMIVLSRQIDNWTPEKSGQFLSYKGDELPW